MINKTPCSAKVKVQNLKVSKSVAIIIQDSKHIAFPFCQVYMHPSFRAIATSTVGLVSTGPLWRQQLRFCQYSWIWWHAQQTGCLGSHVATVDRARDRRLQIVLKRCFLVFKAQRCNESPSWYCNRTTSNLMVTALETDSTMCKLVNN